MKGFNHFYLIEPDDWHFKTSRDVENALLKADDFSYKYGSLDQVEGEIEEFVRQWVIRELITVYGFPEEHIDIEQYVQTRYSYGEIDIALKDQDFRLRILGRKEESSLRARIFLAGRCSLTASLSTT